MVDEPTTCHCTLSSRILSPPGKRSQKKRLSLSLSLQERLMEYSILFGRHFKQFNSNYRLWCFNMSNKEKYNWITEWRLFLKASQASFWKLKKFNFICNSCLIYLKVSKTDHHWLHPFYFLMISFVKYWNF